MAHIDTEVRRRDVDDPASPVEWVRCWASLTFGDIDARGELYVRDEVKDVVKAVRLELEAQGFDGASINVSTHEDYGSRDLTIIAWGPYRMPIPDGVHQL